MECSLVSVSFATTVLRSSGQRRRRRGHHHLSEVGGRLRTGRGSAVRVRPGGSDSCCGSSGVVAACNAPLCRASPMAVRASRRPDRRCRTRSADARPWPAARPVARPAAVSRSTRGRAGRRSRSPGPPRRRRSRSRETRAASMQGWVAGCRSAIPGRDLCSNSRTWLRAARAALIAGVATLASRSDRVTPNSASSVSGRYTRPRSRSHPRRE